MALPNWTGAAEVYSKAYRTLEHMGRNGHVTKVKHRNRTVCHVSAEMRALIDALDSGHEERIKGLLINHHVYPFIAAA